MNDDFKKALERFPPDRQQLIRLLEKEGYFDFERVKYGKHTYILAKYPDDWQTNFVLKIRTTDITPLNVARHLMDHSHEFQRLVERLLIQYMEKKLDANS